jgi:hypothetical protein
MDDEEGEDGVKDTTRQGRLNRIYNREYSRVMGLIRSGKLERDNRLAVVDIDGLLQFVQLDFIPFFYCSGEVVEGYINEWFS